MRNTLVLIKREYLARVRTRSFLVLTLLLPALMTVLMSLPAKLATMGEKQQHIVIVASNAQFGESVRQQLLATPTDEDDPSDSDEKAKQKPAEQYTIDVDTNPTDAERAVLRDKVSDHSLSGFLWLTDDAIAAKKVTWNCGEMADFRERSWLSEGVSHVVEQQQLAHNGLSAAQADQLLEPVKIAPIRIERGRESKGSGTGRLLEIVVMVMLLYLAVLFYGISVMRSVLEEKTTRIMEVLLSSATSTQLMIGKILGVGAVGLTQILAWVVMAAVVAFPSLAAQPSLSELQISPGVLAAFAAFFFLGYLLYSTMYAAVGAITTTEQEGQQLQFFVILPLVLSVFMLTPVFRTPDSPLVTWLSMVPFFSPIVMYARIIIQTPPLWQIAVSLILLAATVAGLMILCARIYRVGVLIYGKRPNLPEILRWLKYAKA
jgi:ABC-2 type transport system permease protein